ncbi:efflux RND transporter periplasmic adaptor subunit [Rhizobium sp. BK602]|uniref:efflux RND transporter periplasmic adaptor subunit n=1 Tax=Rhizobium sp. BK602 TaxID=2586986 RepID=UPI00160CEEDD|nr:efflux RND transporter periplasmic adaptor subunit [Rhizobium sp. BK602]MBB3613005.1 RND family efflux transporter MFP subunit [Rhizobium sp. BK602]
MNKTLSVTLVTAIMLLSGCSEQDEMAAKAPRPIRSVTAHFQELGETVTQTGEVRPRIETAMSFRLDGQLTYRVENGSTVKAGDVVARLDRTTAQNNLLTAKADVATAKAALDLADVTAQRNRDLFAKSISSRAQMQEAEANLETAGAKVEATAAALANAEEALSYTELRAEHDGIVAATGANEGQVVSAGQMVVTVISDADRDAIFDVPEKLINMKTEPPYVEVGLISNPDVKAKGMVREITPSADPVTRTYRVKVALDAAAKEMPFGAAVIGSLVLSPQKLMELPASALTDHNGQPAVFVFNPATRELAYKAVQLTRFDDKSIFIAQGLTEGDVVAVAGVSKLREGESVVLDDEGAK